MKEISHLGDQLAASVVMGGGLAEALAAARRIARNAQSGRRPAARQTTTRH